MEALWQDVRYGFRLAIRNPGFSSVIILALALGIGVNTSVFSIVNAVLLRPLPFNDSERLVILWNRLPGFNTAQDWLSTAEYFDLKTQSDVFDDIAISIGGGFNLTSDNTPQRVEGLRVSSSFFSVLNVAPALGSTFQAGEDQPGKPLTVIISHELWQRLFRNDLHVIEKTLTLDGQTATIIGVMPAGFSLNKEVIPTTGGIERADIFLPLPLDAEAQRYRGRESYTVLARLKNGVPLAQAQAQVGLIAERLAKEYPVAYPANSRFSIIVVPLLEQVVGRVRPALFVLLGAVTFVLLIACANVTNLLLARAAARQKEFAIRTSVGAYRSRLIRQLLTESALFALASGGLGLLIARLSLDALRRLGPDNIPRLAEINIDGRVLAFTFAVSLATGILFGIAPALRASQVDLNEMLKESGRSSMHRPHAHTLRDALVISEIALSLALLVGAGLLLRSFIQLHKVNPGFSVQNMISMRLALTGHRYSGNEARVAFYSHLWKRLENLPGVEAAGGASVLPLSSGIAWGNIWVEGFQDTTVIQADHRLASPDYFRAMRIPLLKGRYFDEHDLSQSERVAIVDESLAERFWRNEDPLGRQIKLGQRTSNYPLMKVVGVVGPVNQYSLDAQSPRVAFYTPPTQDTTVPSDTMYVVVRTKSEPARMIDAVTSEIRAVDHDLPIYDVATLEQRLADSLAKQRFSLMLLSLFGALAATLASLGVYSVISLSVTQRTHEIGIRMAVGATTGNILKLVLNNGLKLALIGVVVGLAGAFALTRVMRTLLFGVTPTDAVTFATVSVGLIAVALLACYLPARRATKVDPLVALRYD